MTKKFSEVQKVYQRVYIRHYHFSAKKATLKQFNQRNRINTTTNNTSLFQKLLADFLLLPKKVFTIAGHTPLRSQLNQIKKNSNKKIIKKRIGEIHPLLSNSTPFSQNAHAHYEKNGSHKNIQYSHSVLAKSPHSSSQAHVSEKVSNDFNTTAFKQTEHTWCIAIAPIHLRGLDAIGKIFGKSRGTVKSWCKEGAPIAYDGTSYCSEYNALFAWYLNHYKYDDEKALRLPIN